MQDLVPGEYTVTEVENDVTAKYIIEAGKTVTITSGDEPVEVEFHNKLKRGSVYAVKTAEGAPGENLPGAEFAVYTDMDGNAEFDPETYTLFGKLEYTEDGYSLSGLTVGGYFLHEEKAPEGYTADGNYYFFKLTEDGERVEVTAENEKIPATPSKDVPKTGDTRPYPWLIGGIALAMLACVGRLFWYLRKHRRT